MKGLTDFAPDSYYHLVNHAVGSELLFRYDENYKFFLKRYAHYMPSVCDTISYCLMPNHIHILIRVHLEETLQKHPKYKGKIHKLVMQEWSNLLNSYAKSYNKVFNRKGALWIDYTKRFVIKPEVYLANAVNYIHQNPVKHGFVESPEDWQHSSFNSLLSDKKTRLERAVVFDWFGSKTDFIEFHNSNRSSLNEQWEY